MKPDIPSIIVIAGPTGVGKTAFSLAAAEALNAEIVSIDSVQVYRGLDIGSAKATAAERERVPHHLIDIFDPDEDCNVADYMAMAHEAITEIHGRGRHVICTGGTNLYMRVLVHGIFDAPEPDPAIRAQHKAFAAEHGIPALHQQLTEIDAELAERIHENDLVRISRGLEVHAQTGRKLSELQDEHRFATPNYAALKLGFNRPREELYERINHRVDAMMQAGFLDEYKRLIATYDPSLKPLQSLGYRHMGLHVNEGQPLDEVIELLKRDTRRFAKQQVSWLRSEEGLVWALAPLMHDATIPAVVLDDLKKHLDGTLNGPPDWVSSDSEVLKDVPS